MENRGNNKVALVVAIAALAIVGIVAGTYAYFTSQATVTNTFTATSYSTQVVRSLANQSWLPGTTINNFNLNVSNTGTTPIVVRATVSDSFERVTGDSRSVSGLDPASVITKTFNTTGWTLGSDGKYYYTSVVAGSSATTNLITGLTFNASATNDSSCTYDDNAGTENTTDPQTGNVTCTSGVNGYDNTNYVLSVTFDTIQWDQAKTGGSWASTAPAALVTAADNYSA